MTLRGDPSTWPEPYADHYAERIAVMEVEGIQDAARKAMLDVQRMADREQGGLF